MTKSLQNQVYQGFDNREALIDLEIPEIFNGKLIVFAHGFMGYKDWGAWNLVQRYFTDLGFGFCKFSFTHNGTTPKNPTEFADFEAFSKDSYWREHQDLNAVIRWLRKEVNPLPPLFLIGHSQGGGIVLTHAQNPAIERIVTWATLSDFQKRFPMGETLNQWKKDGVMFRMNSRTQQNLPLSYLRYEEYLEHADELNLKELMRSTPAKLLFIHGTEDTSVDPQESKDLAEWSGQTLRLIENTGHTFDSKEPWESLSLPAKLLEVCSHTASFFLLSKHYAK